jgi:D-beta-D-heptose 7-phosphate kinase/D-beta-D-heptose 1-phosphate adenosyltransferase
MEMNFEDHLAQVVSQLSKLRSNRRVNVLVWGDVMVDEYLSGSADRISPEAPIPVVVGQDSVSRLGGAANVAANLAKLGAAVSLVGVVGDDAGKLKLDELLSDVGISSDLMIADSDRQTTRKLRIVSGVQQIVRVDFEDAQHTNEQTAAAIAGALYGELEEARVLIVSDYAKGACPAPLLREVIKFCNSNKITVLIDPKGSDFSKYAGADIVKPNRQEAFIAASQNTPNTQDPRGAGEWLIDQHAFGACVITLGAEGSLLLEGNVSFAVPAFTRDVSDVTGAGDCVAAGLGFAVAHGLSLSDACVFANAVGSISVSKLGSVAVSFEEVQARYQLAGASAHHGGAALLDEVVRILARRRESGDTIVFTNGCFDILHAGHVQNLNQAAGFGSVLVVGINSDASVRRLKGEGRPINSADDRAAVIANLRSVDLVVEFDDDTPLQLIETISPDVLIKGADYSNKDVVGREYVESCGGRVELLALRDGLSSSTLIEKMRKSAR